MAKEDLIQEQFGLTAKEGIEDLLGKEPGDRITRERLREILSILFPWGYSHYKEVFYTGVSPFIDDATNIITVIVNDPIGRDSVFSICIEKYNEDSDVNDCLPFYKGIMKLIAPRLYCKNDKSQGQGDVLDFNWAPYYVKGNAFPAKVILKVRKRHIDNEQRQKELEELVEQIKEN